MILELNSENPQPRLIKQIAEVMKSGGLAVYPTDTTYGLGCDINNKAAIERILAIKRMPRNKLLSIICCDLRDVSQYAYVSNNAYKIIKRLAPGPYTFVLQATKLVPKIMLTRQKTIGARLPSNNIALAIAKELGRPIISTSVRLPNNDVILTEPYEIQERLGHLVEIVVDSGIILPFPSTVVDLTRDVPEILREGKGAEALKSL